MTCSCRFQKVTKRVYGTVCYPGPSISVLVYVTPLRSPRRFTCYISSCNFPSMLMFFSSSLSPQAVYGMDDVSSNLRETHPATCPLYRKYRTPPASKVANKLARRTKYFPTFRWPKKDVAKRTAKYNISCRHSTLFWRLFHGDHMTVS